MPKTDEELESEAESEAMAIVETTDLCDSDTDQSSIYSYDRDVEFHEQMLSSDEETPMAGANNDRAYDSSYMFPSSSSVSLRFLYRTGDGISVISPLKEEVISPRFRIAPLRRTGEVELQIEMKAGASFKDIEIGLERCTKYDTSTNVQFLCPSDQSTESSCIFSVCGAVFNNLKRNASVNISYSQEKFSLLKGVNQIGLKITRDGALEFFMNGQSQGIAAEAVYKLGRNMVNHPSTVYYPILWLPLGNNKTVLTAGGNVHAAINFSVSSSVLISYWVWVNVCTSITKVL